jgi:hypothetical protein
MDGLRELLMELRRQGHARGVFRGLLNLFIGRRIETPSGETMSNGLTWRELSELLKRVRWEKSSVRELGLDPAALPPRDRERFWYLAIARGDIDSDEATKAGDKLAEILRSMGFKIGPAPRQTKGA